MAVASLLVQVVLLQLFTISDEEVSGELPEALDPHDVSCGLNGLRAVQLRTFATSFRAKRRRSAETAAIAKQRWLSALERQRRLMPTARQLTLHHLRHPPPWPEDHSIFLFNPQHPLRRKCNSLVKRGVIEPLIIVLILASSVCLAIDSPRLQDNATQNTHPST